MQNAQNTGVSAIRKGASAAAPRLDSKDDGTDCGIWDLVGMRGIWVIAFAIRSSFSRTIEPS